MEGVYRRAGRKGGCASRFLCWRILSGRVHNRNHRDLRRVDNAIDGKIAQIGYGKFPRAVHLTIVAQQRKVFQPRDGLQNALNNAVGGGLVVLRRLYCRALSGRVCFLLVCHLFSRRGV